MMGVLECWSEEIGRISCLYCSCRVHRSATQVPICDRLESGEGAGSGAFRGAQRAGDRSIGAPRHSESQQRVHPLLRVRQVGRG